MSALTFMPRARFVLAMTTGMAVAALVAMATLVPQVARAQVAADFKACGAQKGEAAIQACTRVIDSKDAKVKMQHAYFNRGVEWGAAGKYDNAIADYSAAIKIDPTYREAFNNRGNAYRRKGDSINALADYTEAIKLNPKRGLYYRNRGIVLQDKRDYARALADFEEAFKLDANDASAIDSAAWIRATAPDSKLRNGKLAVELATKACELTKWKTASYVDTLAAAHAEDGNYKEAVKRQEEALAVPEFEKSDGKNARNRLKLYKSGKPVRLKA